MKYLEKINVVDDKLETISMFSNAFERKLDSMGIDVADAIVKVCAECPKIDEIEAMVKATKANYVVDGLIHKDKFFDVFAAGSSDIRKATDLWLRHDLLPIMGKWCMCGLETKNMKLAINKYMAYIGLLFSASKPFTDVFGKKIDIRRVAIIKDAEVIVNAVADLVDAGG